MFYTFRDCEVKINDLSFFATNISLSAEANSAPLFYTEERKIGDNVATDGVKGTAQISYYLTGVDPIKAFINDEDAIASGNFGGLNFSSGYLRGYSFDAAPNTPVIINADIVFFSALSGSFSPSNKTYTGLTPLNFSDMTLEGEGVGDVNKIQGIKYVYTTEITPIYVDRSGSNGSAEGVIFGRNNISLDISSDNLDQSLPVTGQGGTIDLYLRDPETNIVESFNIEGVIKRRGVGASAGGQLSPSFTLIQDGLLGRPSISSVVPSSAEAGDLISIMGSNFYNILEVCFNDRIANFTLVNPNLITATVPAEAISGPLNIITFGGKATFENFIVLDGGMGGI